MTTNIYNIKYTNYNNNNYIYLDETSTIEVFNKLINYIPDDKVISKTEFVNRLNKFNMYIKEISKYIIFNNNTASINFISKLMNIPNNESKILLKVIKLVNTNLNEIKNNDVFKKKQLGGFLDSCNTLILVSDIAGMLPAVGIPIDIGGVILSIVCGDYFGAGLGLISIIPVLGWLSGGVEIVRGILKLTGVLSSDDKTDNDNSSPFSFIDDLIGNKDTEKSDNKSNKNNDRKFDLYEYEYKDKEHYEYEYYDNDIYKYEYYDI